MDIHLKGYLRQNPIMKISDTRLENFRRILAEKGLRLTDIADLLGKAPAQVSAFGGKNPTKSIGDKIAREIERALDLIEGSLDIHAWNTQSDQVETSLGVPTRYRVPVLDSLNAGQWLLNTTRNEDAAQEFLVAPSRPGPRSFAFVVDGMSMEPRFTAGDKVIINPAKKEKQAAIVAAFNRTTQITVLRQLNIEVNDVYFVALNTSWPERIIKMDNNWTILGVATWLISEL
ncbi:S24 family peptidase [Pseudomonas viridiflava]|uniref:S24 family peptidase n=1 Tax=Pseudomonas viridiflava TaxID=33069 RepID=UPI001F1375E8|nr:S24 family peptidase [Pseudomonas viridiflava]